MIGATIAIGDTEKGEVPNNGEFVYVYDEYNDMWERADTRHHILVERDYLHRYFTICLRILDNKQYHRWTRLPVLNEGV